MGSSVPAGVFIGIVATPGLAIWPGRPTHYAVIIAVKTKPSAQFARSASACAPWAHSTGNTITSSSGDPQAGAAAQRGCHGATVTEQCLGPVSLKDGSDAGGLSLAVGAHRGTTVPSPVTVTVTGTLRA
jgi:hypothetical protein